MLLNNFSHQSSIVSVSSTASVKNSLNLNTQDDYGEEMDTNQDEQEPFDENESNSDNEDEFLYLTLDLPFDAVNKLKNLTLDQLNQIKQLGILSAHFENEDSILKFDSSLPSSLPLKHPEPPTINSESSNQTNPKKRARKTIMELTSSQSNSNTEPQCTTETNKPNKKAKLNQEYVLTSSIVDQSSMQLQANNSSSMIASILNQETSSFQIPNEPNTLYMSDDLRNIYQIRQMLSQQTKESEVINEVESEKPKTKARRAPPDPNKPKVKRTAKSKTESKSESQQRINQIIQNSFCTNSNSNSSHLTTPNDSMHLIEQQQQQMHTQSTTSNTQQIKIRNIFESNQLNLPVGLNKANFAVSLNNNNGGNYNSNNNNSSLGNHELNNGNSINLISLNFEASNAM